MKNKKTNLPNVWNKAKTWPTEGTLYLTKLKKKLIYLRQKKVVIQLGTKLIHLKI